MMGSAKPVRISARFPCLIFLAVSAWASIATATQPSLVVVKLSHGLPVNTSTGSKTGTSVVCERVHIGGLPRLKNLGKIAHVVKVNVLQRDPSIRTSKTEVCLHRNVSLGVGMCPQGQWEKVIKGSWVRSMSPFDNRILDIWTAGSSLEPFEVSIEEVLMSLASPLSKSFVFYYGGAMSIGVILVILIILFQVGLGSFLLCYLPGLLRMILKEIGISEDMYNPLAIFLLAFLVLTGAWMGFWAVRKLVLTEDGSIDISTSNFVAWSIRILAAVMILQSSADPLLAAEALISGILISSSLWRIFRFIHRLCKYDFTIPELNDYLPSSGIQDLLPFHPLRNTVKSPKKNRRRSWVPNLSAFEDSDDKYTYKVQSDEDPIFLAPQAKNFTLASCKSAERGFSRTSPCQQSDSELYPSTFHTTPEKKIFSKAEWKNFTRHSTEKAMEELVSSPDFS